MFRTYYGAQGTLAATTSAVATTIAVSAALASALSTLGADWTYLKITDGYSTEIVKVTAVSGVNLTVERGVDDTTPYAFLAGATICFVLPAAGVVDLATGVVSVPSFSVAGDGIAAATYADGVYTVDVPAPNFTSTTLDITGTWPNLTFEINEGGCSCCGGDSGSSVSGTVELIGGGVTTVTETGENAYTISTPMTSIASGSGITVSGSYPNFTVSLAGTSGSVTTVISGTGIVITGSASVSPTINIASTGVTPGNYGGVVINAQGQLTAVPGTFNPVSVVNVSAPVTVSRSTDAVTLGVSAAAVGTAGVVPLADPGESLDGGDSTSAVSPALLANVLATASGAVISSSSVYVSEIDTDYDNIVTTITPLALNLTSSQKALVSAVIQVRDTVDPTNVVVYGFGLFTASTKLAAMRETPQCIQNLTTVVTGPVDITMLLKTTALPYGSEIVSASITVVKANA